MRASAALYARIFGKLADKCDFRARGRQGERTLVFQQDDTFLCNISRLFVVCGAVKGVLAFVFVIAVIAVNLLQYAFYCFVEDFLVKLSAFYRLDDFSVVKAVA